MITIETRGLAEAIKALSSIPRKVPTVLRNALNDTARHIRADAVRTIRRDWAVKAATVRSAIDIKSATVARLESRVRVKGKPLPLRAFSARQTRRGVSVRVRANGPRVLVRGAFIAAMHSGHRGVFRRTASTRRTGTPYHRLPQRRVMSGAWAGTVYRPALPIGERYVVTVPSMWAQKLSDVQREASAYLARRVEVGVERALSGPS